MHKWRRHLPHIEVDGATYFLTFCLHQYAPVDLTEPRFGAIVVGALRHFAGVRYILFDYTVMPDHVHVILKPMVERPKSSLEAILHSIKSFTANQINELLGGNRRIWQDETWDEILNSERAYRTVAAYIWENPHERGLVANPAKWPWWGNGLELSERRADGRE